MKDFRSLDVWKKSHGLVLAAFKLPVSLFAVIMDCALDCRRAWRMSWPEIVNGEE